MNTAPNSDKNPRWETLWDTPEFQALNLGPSARHKFRRMLKLVGSLNLRGDFLDVGCGRGQLLDLLRSRSTSLSGIDIAPRAVDITTSLVPGSRAYVLDVEISHLSQTFDGVFCTNALEEMKDDVSALRNMAGMLKPGGTLLISTPHRMAYWTEKDNLGGNYRRYEKQDLIEKLRNLGLEIVLTQTWGWPLYRIWYGGMTQVDQNTLWKKAGLFTRIVSQIAYLILFFDDLFVGNSRGSFIFVAARKPGIASK